MHDSVYAWIATQVAKHTLAYRNVLEIGSLNVNGSVRPLFTGSYMGIDFRDGPGVDRVVDAHKLPFDTGAYDVIVCTEMLEHDSAFWLTLAEIKRTLAPYGHLLLTTRGNGFPAHGYPEDYWRFMEDTAPLLAKLAGCDLLEWARDDLGSPGILVHGYKSTT